MSAATLPNTVPVNITPLPVGNFKPSVTVISFVTESVAVAVSANSIENVGPRSVADIVNSVVDGCDFT